MCSLLWMNTNQNRKQKDYNEGPWQVACLRIMSYFSKLVICIPTILLPLAFELFSKLFWEGMGYSGWKFCMNVWRRGVESFIFFWGMGCCGGRRYSEVDGYGCQLKMKESYIDLWIILHTVQVDSISLCCLRALAEATYRNNFCRLASSSAASASQKISVTFFSGTTQASFLIFDTDHQYGELYCVTHFWICGMSTSCFTELWILWT